MKENGSPPNEETKPVKKNIVRRLYDWVLSWAETKYGTPALFILAFLESSVFPVPPDVLQIALSASKPKRSFWYATVSLVGSVLGAFLGFLIGFTFWATTQDFFYSYLFSREAFDQVAGLYDKHGFWAILITAPTPIPYKLFTIAAVVCGISLWVLFIASVFGRGARFYTVAAVMYFFGPTVIRLVDRYFNLAIVLFVILVVLGFVAIKYIHLINPV